MGLLDLFLPERCAACDALSGGAPGLCTSCALSLYPLGAACPVCGEPGERAERCRRCAAAPPPFYRLDAPYRYGGELATALCRLKYGGAKSAGRFELARPLGALLAPALAVLLTPALGVLLTPGLAAGKPDLLVPVPLHPARLRARGFSQAHALCAAARATLGAHAPPLAAVLERHRATSAQAGLNRAGRARNVNGAFAVAPRAVPRIAGRAVLLIDDVVTTGATAAACATALLAAGAARVSVLALARAEA